MQILIAPDSFKGSLSAAEVSATIQKALSEVISNVKIDVVPMADGGEGTIDCLVYSTNGTKVEIDVTGPLMDHVTSCYGILGDKSTVVIEAASVAGLTMVPLEKRNPLHTTTYGIGEIIHHALNKGFRKFIIGLGGSATNDGGLGMLQAMGVKFFDCNGENLSPTGGSLSKISTVDFDQLDPRIYESEIIVASDVINPLCGPTGASYTFAIQKGAKPEQITLMDQSLQHYANLIENYLGIDIQNQQGAGAAGGLGFALLALGAVIQSGATVVGVAANLERKMYGVDWVISGEGQSDYQTVYGKVPYYVAKLAKESRVKALLMSASLGEGYEQLLNYFVGCFSIIQKPSDLDFCMVNAEKLLYEAAQNIGRLLNIIHSDESMIDNLMKGVRK